jgi:hypothetical protein
MHDPMTVAWSIKLPIWHTIETRDNEGRLIRKDRYFYELATIWHNDPEKDGSDDSCGWSRPKLTKDQREMVKWLAHDEARYPWIAAIDAERITDPVRAECLVRGAFLLVAQCMRNRGMSRRQVSVEEATRWAALLVHNGIDNFRSSLCFKSGYHSNWYRSPEPNTPAEDLHWRERNAEDFFAAILKYILRERRPWFLHPRWHIHHWSIQIQLFQQLNRWMFSRCSVCRKGFKWGESVMGSWDGNKIWHMQCDQHPPSAQGGIA